VSVEYRNCWCVVDYEDNFIIVRIAKQHPNGETCCEEEHIVPTTGFDASYAAWDAFHDDWKFGPCPYPIYADSK